MNQAETGSVRLSSSDRANSAPQGVEPRHLRYFVASAGADTFTRAAEQIFIAQAGGAAPGSTTDGGAMSRHLDSPPACRGTSTPVLYDSATMPPGDRLRRLRDAMADAVVPVEVEHHVSPEQVAAKCIGRRVGTLSILTISSTPMTLRRTPRLAGADVEPCVILEIQLAGRRTITQDDRQTELGPGDLNLLDTTRPYTSVNLDGTNHYCVRIPRSRLGLPDQTLRRITGLRLDPQHPASGLAAAYLAKLAGDDRLAALPGLDAFEAPTIELIRAVIGIRLGDDRRAGGPPENTLALRILEFARQHLTDHDLSAAKIAKAHHISVRHLYATLARSGVVLSEWIRMQRLEECRRDLAQTGRNMQTILFVAHRWGFGDATHFSRSFRAAFGMSPREWRALHQEQTR
jgi:AraC-like DNA-binding protein